MKKFVSALAAASAAVALAVAPAGSAVGKGKPKPPAPTPTSDACGTVLTKADGSPWSCTLADNFDGTSLNRSVWLPQTQFASGVQEAHACYLDDPSVINVANGSLNLTLRKVANP